MTRQYLRSKAGLVIDTNLLLLYLVGLHDPDRIETFKRSAVAYRIEGQSCLSGRALRRKPNHHVE